MNDTDESRTKPEIDEAPSTGNSYRFESKGEVGATLYDVLLRLGPRLVFAALAFCLIVSFTAYKLAEPGSEVSLFVVKFRKSSIDVESVKTDAIAKADQEYSKKIANLNSKVQLAQEKQRIEQEKRTALKVSLVDLKERLKIETQRADRAEKELSALLPETSELKSVFREISGLLLDEPEDTFQYALDLDWNELNCAVEVEYIVDAFLPEAAKFFSRIGNGPFSYSQAREFAQNTGTASSREKRGSCSNLVYLDGEISVERETPVRLLLEFERAYMNQCRDDVGKHWRLNLNFASVAEATRAEYLLKSMQIPSHCF